MPQNTTRRTSTRSTRTADMAPVEERFRAMEAKMDTLLDRVTDLSRVMAPPTRARRTAPAPTAETRRPTVRATPTDHVHTETLKEAMVAVMRRTRTPQGPKAITEKLMNRDGGTKPVGTTPVATVGSIMAVENKKPDGLFVRTAPGLYTLRTRG